MNDNPEKLEPIMAKLAEPKTEGLSAQANDEDGAARVVTGLLVGLLVLGGSAFAAYYFWTNQEEAERRPKRTNIPSVQGVRLQPTNFTIHLPSQGRVQARAISSINPEVAGRVISIEPAFKEGGFFTPGQKLLTLDNFDYLNAVSKAEATISQLNAKLELEKIERAAFTNAVAVAQANLEQAQVALQLDKIESTSFTSARDVAQANLEQATVALNLEKLERSSYSNAVTLAKANLSQAQANEKLKLAEQDAAIANLKRLGKFEGSSPLARKEPQVAEAKANTLAKEVALDKAQEDMKKRPDQMEADLQAKIKVARSKLAEAMENLKLPKQRAADLRAKIKVAQVQLAEAGENLKRPDQREADIQAQINIAKSEAEQARRNARRTTILAPDYHGRITEKRVDIGQVVTTGTVLATAIATDLAEVRLPISNHRLAHLDLPEQLVNINNTQAHKNQQQLDRPAVKLTAEIGAKAYHEGKWLHKREITPWEGWIDRAESRYDSTSQQLFLIAHVEEPYGSLPALRAGLFVRADITGKTLDNVFILPRRAVRRGNEVALSIKWHPPRAFPGKQEQNTKKPSQKGPPPKVKGKKKNKIPDILVRREIVVLWRDKKWIITESLKKDDILITTPIDYATNGQELDVDVQGEPPPNSDNGNDKPRKGGKRDGPRGKNHKGSPEK